MLPLLQSLLNLLTAVWDVFYQLVAVVLPWFPLIAWAAFWLLAVDWRKLFPILMRGGLIGVFFVYFLTILIWGLIAPPEGGYHHALGLQIGNFVGKTVYVTSLFSIAAICASVQMSGAVNSLLSFPEDCDDSADDHGHAAAH